MEFTAKKPLMQYGGFLMRGTNWRGTYHAMGLAWVGIRWWNGLASTPTFMNNQSAEGCTCVVYWSSFQGFHSGDGVQISF